MRRAHSIGQIFAIVDDVLAWLSFLATSVIALTLAAYGHAPAFNGIQNTRTLPPTLRRLSPILAALAAVFTAASNMTNAQSREWYDKADDTYQAIVVARQELTIAETADEQQDVLDALAIASRR